MTQDSFGIITSLCFRDSFVVGIGNALTSIYSGFVIFAVLGYMAHIKGLEDVNLVTKKGTTKNLQKVIKAEKKYFNMFNVDLCMKSMKK